MSDYSRLRSEYIAKFSSEDWLREREERWKRKDEDQLSLDLALFSTLVDESEFPERFYDKDIELLSEAREKFRESRVEEQDAIDLIHAGASNDHLFQVRPNKSISITQHSK